MKKTKEEIIAMSREEYDSFMVSTFPNQFIERGMSMQETCMCWGFDIGKGWYYILYELCYKLDYIEKKFATGVIWKQIKEKFGSARFYYNIKYSKAKTIKYKVFSAFDKIGISSFKNAEDKLNNIVYELIDSMIDKAESKTDKTCEISGEEYYHCKPSIGGWVYGMSRESFLAEYPERKEALEASIRHSDLVSGANYALWKLSDEELQRIIDSVNKPKESDTDPLNKAI